MSNRNALSVGDGYEKAGNFPADMTGKDPTEAKQQKADQAERLQAFGQSLASQRDEWINARRASGWDKRVQEDLDQYHARDNAGSGANMMESVEQGFPVVGNKQKATRSTVFIGLTRQKSNAAEARLSDILLPTDENNWSIQPTPKPEMTSMLGDPSQAQDPSDPTGQTPFVLHAAGPDGQMAPTAVKKADIALALQAEARKKALGMGRLIEDQLTESDLNGQERKIIHDAAVMGTGVLKGPVTTNKVRNSWQQVQGDVYALVRVEEKTPASYWIDARCVWEDPDCGDDIQNGKGIYELEQLTKKKVRALKDQPGYMEEQLRIVLGQGPQRSTALVELTNQLSRNLYQKNTFDVWHYTGEIDAQDAADAGMEIDPEDELQSVSACVVMINDTVVKVYPNPLETEELPYDFYPWEKVTDSPRGYGVPYLMRAPQRVINAAWRMMMDNAAVCAGPQIIIKKNKVEPEDKTWNLYARKVWQATVGNDESVADAFTLVEITMHQEELAAIIKLGMELADAETSTPLITQGEQGGAPDTVGGMQMLMNSANVVLRRLVKQFDDYVTKRHIRRYYDFNMMYSDDESIKGDFDVDARGSSALLVRDIQNQAFTNLLAAGSNPVYSKYLDPKKLFEKSLQAQHIQPEDVMKSDDQIAQEEEFAKQNPAPQDPRIQAAMITAKSRVEESAAKEKTFENELALRQKIAEQNHSAKLAELEITREIAMLKYANEQKVTLDKVKADLAITAMNNRQKAEQLQTEATLKVTEGSGI